MTAEPARSTARAAVPLRIALLLESDGPGGAESMLMQLAEELRRRGHEVCPVGPAAGCGWLAEQFRMRGFEPEQFTLQGVFDWGCVRGLMQVFERRRIDVVHSHEFTMALYGGIAARMSRLPHVVTMHGTHYVMAKARRRLVMRLVHRLGTMATVSRASRDQLTSSFRLPTSSIASIPNGIEYRPGDRQIVRHELGLRDDDLLVVAVGNLRPYKGHAHLLRALISLGVPPAGPSWHCAIAGRGPEEGPLKEIAERGGVSDRVHLLGTRTDVPNVLAAADVFAMPSTWEGLPVAVLEAMFAGRAIVASDVGGIPEAVTSGEQGLIVPPGDDAALAAALGRLLGDASLRVRFGNAARERAQREFSIEVMVDEYERLYRGHRAAS